MPEYAEIKNLDNWVHYHPAILGLGRTTHWVSDKDKQEEGKEDEILAALQENDPEIERLKSIIEEKCKIS